MINAEIKKRRKLLRSLLPARVRTGKDEGDPCIFLTPRSDQAYRIHYNTELFYGEDIRIKMTVFKIAGGNILRVDRPSGDPVRWADILHIV